MHTHVFLYLHGTVSKVSGTKAGDKVLVELGFDHNYRNGPQHEMPEQFASALAHNPVASENWSKLSPSRQKEVLRYLARLKSLEAKERNIRRAMAVLSGKPERFMGRSWQNGS